MQNIFWSRKNNVINWAIILRDNISRLPVHSWQFLTSTSWWIMDNGQRGSRPFDCKSYQSLYAECVWWLRIQFCRYNGKALPTTQITNGWLKNQSYNLKFRNILRAHRISSNLLSVHILYMHYISQRFSSWNDGITGVSGC